MARPLSKRTPGSERRSILAESKPRRLNGACCWRHLIDCGPRRSSMLQCSCSTMRRARDFPATRATLEVLAKGDRAARFAQFVISAGVAGLRREDIAARTAWREEVIDRTFAEAERSGAVIRVEHRFLSRASFDELD